mgnify:FL=1
MNSYEKYLVDYPEYKKLIEILGEHYLESPDEEISFLLDEFELNNLLDTDVSLEEIKNACTNLLTGNNQKELSSGKIFGNLINLHKHWEDSSSPGYPPQLPLIIFLIIVASEMGSIDWYSAYFKPLSRALSLDETDQNQRTRLRNQYISTFSENALFEDINTWVVNNKGKDTSFREGSTNKHVGWVVEQAIFNQKDLYSLTDFYKQYEINEFQHDITKEFVKHPIIHQLNRYFFSNAYREKRFSTNFRKAIKDFNRNDTSLQNLIVNKLYNHIKTWDGTVVSPIGLQELHSRFAFEFNRADNVCIWNRLIILPGSNLELSNEEIATNENTNEEITYSKDPQGYHFWETEINDLNSERNDNFQNKKLRASFRSNPVRIYEKKESGDLSIPNVWVELDQSLKPQRNEEYVVSCSEEFLDETQRYLKEFAIDFDENKCFSIHDHKFYYDIEFYENRTYKDNELDIFNPEKTDTKRLKLSYGLEVSNNSYLINFLPTLFIPNDFFQESENLEIIVNESTISIDKNPEGNTTELDLNTVSTLNNYSGEVRVNCLQNIKFNVEKHKTLSEIRSEEELKILGWNIKPKDGELSLDKISAHEINTQERLDGFISGGELHLTDEYKITEDSIVVNNVKTKFDTTWIICSQIGHFRKVENTIDSWGINQKKFRLFDHLNEENLLCRINKDTFVEDFDIFDEFFEEISLELRPGMSQPVWEISQKDDYFYIRQLSECEPVHKEPDLSNINSELLKKYSDEYYGPIKKRSLTRHQVSNWLGVELADIHQFHQITKNQKNMESWKQIILKAHKSITDSINLPHNRENKNLILGNKVWMQFLEMANS